MIVIIIIVIIILILNSKDFQMDGLNVQFDCSPFSNCVINEYS
jgi:hypothetical protein